MVLVSAAHTLGKNPALLQMGEGCGLCPHGRFGNRTMAARVPPACSWLATSTIRAPHSRPARSALSAPKETMLRTLLVVLVSATLWATAFARGGGSHGSSHSSTGSHYTNGYFRSDGTYVSPHYSTNPNDTKLDNWSTKGNVNPYTGKEGTVDPYRSSPNNGSGSGSRRPATECLYGNQYPCQ